MLVLDICGYTSLKRVCVCVGVYECLVPRINVMTYRIP